MNLLKLALQIVDRVLPSEDFDRRGGDCQLEEIQNHANLTISNFAVHLIETYYGDRLIEENLIEVNNDPKAGNATQFII